MTSSLSYLLFESKRISITPRLSAGDMEFMPEIPPFTSDSGLFVPSTNLCAGDANVQRTGFDFT